MAPPTKAAREPGPLRLLHGRQRRPNGKSNKRQRRTRRDTQRETKKTQAELDYERRLAALKQEWGDQEADQADAQRMLISVGLAMRCLEISGELEKTQEAIDIEKVGVHWYDKAKPGGMRDQLYKWVDNLPTHCTIAGNGFFIDGVLT